MAQDKPNHPDSVFKALKITYVYELDITKGEFFNFLKSNPTFKGKETIEDLDLVRQKYQFKSIYHYGTCRSKVEPFKIIISTWVNTPQRISLFNFLLKQSKKEESPQQVTSDSTSTTVSETGNSFSNASPRSNDSNSVETVCILSSDTASETPNASPRSNDSNHTETDYILSSDTTSETPNASPRSFGDPYEIEFNEELQFVIEEFTTILANIEDPTKIFRPVGRLEDSKEKKSF